MDAETLVANIFKGGKRPFVQRPSSRVLYADLAQKISTCLLSYDSRNLSSGDRVLIATADEDIAIVAFLAALLDGKVPSIVSAQTSPQRLSGIAELFDPAIVVIDAGANWHGVHPVLRPEDVVGSQPRFWQKKVLGRRPSANVSPDNPAYILFTSGTTAEPKGVVISHSALFFQLAEYGSLFDYSEESRIFNGLVLTHVDGLIQGPVLAAAFGATWLRPPPFSSSNLDGWLNQVSALESTHFIGVPTHFGLIDRISEHDDYFDISSLSCLQSVSAKLPKDLKMRIERRFGRPIANHYGLTETVASVLYHLQGSRCDGTGDVGRSIGAEARIVDSEDREVPSGMDGELQLNGPHIFDSYWRAPEMTTRAKTSDGWLRTGDLARQESDGSISIVGRINLAINTSGFLVQPGEIDEALERHPSVIESATLGVPDEIFGEIIVSAVVVDTALTEMALTKHCHSLLEPQKVPKRILVVDAIPRGDVGKLNVAELRDLVAQYLSHQPTISFERVLFDNVLDLAAKVFRVPRHELTAETTPDDVAGWDSFTSISLVIAAERSFDRQLDTATISRIRRLGDLADALR